MGSLPNQAAGLDGGAWLAHWVSQNDLSKLAHRTEDEIRDYFNGLMGLSTPWVNAAQAFFQGILKGFQNLEHFLALMVQSITGAANQGLTYLAGYMHDRWVDLTTLFTKIQSLLDAIGQAFWETLDTGFGITDTFNAIKGLLGLGRGAQESADTANIGVQILKLQGNPGVTGYDEFDYPSAGTLPSAIYDLYAGGPGGGSYGPSGSGFLTWKSSGTSLRWNIYRHKASTLSTDYGSVTAVWARSVPSAMISNDGYGYLCGRFSNTSSATHVRARVSDTQVQIQAVVAGAVTNIGSPVSVTTKSGDTWEFRYGNKATANKYEFKVIQNGTTVLTVNDSSHVSVLESSPGAGDFRQCGFGGQASLWWPALSVPGQAGPPLMAGWTWADQ
ncbi:DUF7257 domain-containing protein [Mycolicibacterium sphagni]|uniref:DUF7257 domain-containing protein n=1 Tax=Mycolicibacterium sphagni TaxID=1786 RepID=A0A255E156_9MYCO|nr:hypothetical protein [Mycolicibacterium sphagni]OYN81783.1 hypothetical protein CG716_05425 [Mycolicibacterium sphagni]